MPELRLFTAERWKRQQVSNPFMSEVISPGVLGNSDRNPQRLQGGIRRKDDQRARQPRRFLQDRTRLNISV